jgi:predicted small lipoprotein YifL
VKHRPILRRLIVPCILTGFLAGCGQAGEPEKPPTAPPMTPEQTKDAINKVSAGRGAMGPTEGKKK